MGHGFQHRGNTSYLGRLARRGSSAMYESVKVDGPKRIMMDQTRKTLVPLLLGIDIDCNYRERRWR
jgi:hypothetical protein